MSTQLLDAQPAEAVDEAYGAQTGTIEPQALRTTFQHTYLRWSNIDPTVLVFLVSVHAACLAAPFFFSWSGLVALVALHWLTCSIGICLGYHRYLTHRSMTLSPPAEFLVLLCAVAAGQGSPLKWAATHRLHHQRSDLEGDPHTPLDGKWWSHILWLFVSRPREVDEMLYERYVPDLAQRPVMRFFERTYGWWLVVVGATLLAVGALIGGVYGAVSLLLWGMGVRMTIAYHSTWLINSATHLWGYRNYETSDQSRNLWWVALLAYGEGWHNNHHAHPSIAPAGHRWWEVDMTWWAIRALRFCGIAKNVKDNIPVPKTDSAEAA